jgi:hypothetical protein
MKKKICHTAKTNKNKPEAKLKNKGQTVIRRVRFTFRSSFFAFAQYYQNN